jgi:hypothetical protein
MTKHGVAVGQAERCGRCHVIQIAHL